MLHISLEPKEQGLLAWALTSVASDLETEIADTENVEFRQDRKERKAVLQSMIEPLDL